MGTTLPHHSAVTTPTHHTHIISSMTAKVEGLVGKEVINKSGEKVAVASLCQGDKVIGLYFSAHRCPPCRGFTPQLVEFYNKFKAANGDKFEVIFMSCDRDESSFKGYYDSMPWLAVDFDDKELTQSAMQEFGIRGIPTLVLLDGATGEVINANARSNVTADMSGANFPWKQ